MQFYRKIDQTFLNAMNSMIADDNQPPILSWVFGSDLYVGEEQMKKILSQAPLTKDSYETQLQAKPLGRLYADGTFHVATEPTNGLDLAPVLHPLATMRFYYNANITSTSNTGLMYVANRPGSQRVPQNGVVRLVSSDTGGGSSSGHQMNFDVVRGSSIVASFVHNVGYHQIYGANIPFNQNDDLTVWARSGTGTIDRPQITLWFEFT